MSNAKYMLNDWTKPDDWIVLTSKNETDYARRYFSSERFIYV